MSKRGLVFQPLISIFKNDEEHKANVFCRQALQSNLQSQIKILLCWTHARARLGSNLHH